MSRQSTSYDFRVHNHKAETMLLEKMKHDSRDHMVTDTMVTSVTISWLLVMNTSVMYLVFKIQGTQQSYA